LLVGKRLSNFSPKVGGVVVDHVFRCSLCRSVPEIFAIKLESCQKWRRILGVFFALPNIVWAALPNLYPRYHACLPSSRLEEIHEVTLTIPKLIRVHTLNFKPYFKCSPLKLLVGPCPHLVCALASLGNLQRVARPANLKTEI